MTPFLRNRRLAIALLLFLGALAPARAVTLVPQEQAIANDMINNPAQGRPFMVLDPVIEAVARARARDMAVRNYFSHLNPDGFAANYLLRQAGYQLPAWWGTDPSANYVESIACGSGSPSVIWTAWMNSPDHKVHLLAQNSFFATETHYGVGYYYDAASTYQYYWVVITAPPQPIEITNPTPAAQVTAPATPVQGATDPATNAASVQFRVENAAGIGAYQAAAGAASWSGTAGLAPGANLIRAQSLDGSGNVIAETVRGITYAVQGTLTVAVSGSGSVTAGFAGVTTQQAGQSITLGASPAPGFIFAGWTGSVVSGSASVTFTMQDGMSLQANFLPNPFATVVGPHCGILVSGSGGQAGLIRLTVSPGGCFTGRVLLGDGAWSFAGSLDSSGSATVSIPQGGNVMTLTLQADLTGGSGEVTGVLTDGAASFTVSASQSTYAAATNAAPQAGRYTLALAPDSAAGASAPQGFGCAVIVVNPAGGAIVAGNLADGTPFTATGQVANDGTLALYCVPSGAPAGSSLTGLLTFRSTASSDLDGALTWVKAPAPRDPFYPAGFTAQMPGVGSRYAQPAAGLGFLDVAPGAASAGFANGNLGAPMSVPVAVNAADKATMATPGQPNLTLCVNPLSGAVTGSFIMPNGNLLRGVRGVVLQKQTGAFGYFRGTTQYGSFSLTPGN